MQASSHPAPTPALPDPRRRTRTFRARLSRLPAWIRRHVRRSPDRFLRHISGVIHVGANTGQERALYLRRGLNVIWVEPIPEVFAALEANLRDFPGQRAFQYLVTDQDDQEYAFHIASNHGMSSSLLDLKLHQLIWPHVTYTATIPVRSITLASLLQREHIDPSAYQGLILDTQGSELLVLRGSIPILRHFQYIKTEVADCELYAGCCMLGDIQAFMAEHGFREYARQTMRSRPGVGAYYNITYRRQAIAGHSLFRWRRRARAPQPD